MHSYLLILISFYLIRSPLQSVALYPLILTQMSIRTTAFVTRVQRRMLLSFYHFGLNGEVKFDKSGCEDISWGKWRKQVENMRQGRKILPEWWMVKIIEVFFSYLFLVFVCFVYFCSFLQALVLQTCVKSYVNRKKSAIFLFCHYQYWKFFFLYFYLLIAYKPLKVAFKLVVASLFIKFIL